MLFAWKYTIVVNVSDGILKQWLADLPAPGARFDIVLGEAGDAGILEYDPTVKALGPDEYRVSFIPKTSLFRRQTSMDGFSYRFHVSATRGGSKLDGRIAPGYLEVVLLPVLAVVMWMLDVPLPMEVLAVLIFLVVIVLRYFAGIRRFKTQLKYFTGSIQGRIAGDSSPGPLDCSFQLKTKR